MLLPADKRSYKAHFRSLLFPLLSPRDDTELQRIGSPPAGSYLMGLSFPDDLHPPSLPETLPPRHPSPAGSGRHARWGTRRHACTRRQRQKMCPGIFSPHSGFPHITTDCVGPFLGGGGADLVLGFVCFDMGDASSRLPLCILHPWIAVRWCLRYPGRTTASRISSLQVLYHCYPLTTQNPPN